MSHKRIETSFDRGVASVSWLLIKFMFVMVPIVFMINRADQGDWLSALTFAPRGGRGPHAGDAADDRQREPRARRVTMARRKVVVKRLNSVQNFGAMDVLCTDKTGTLTQDKIILEHHLDLSGYKDEEILRLGWLNSFHQSGQKNLIDIAVVAPCRRDRRAREAAGLQKIDELPFDFVRRRLSVVVEDRHGTHLLICKGRGREMLAVSTHVQDEDGVRPLDFVARKRLLEQASAYNEDGFRVLVLATRTIPRGDERQQYRTADEHDLVVRGFLTFLDPPKNRPRRRLAALARVAVKVLTGDNPVVTMKVCRQVGLEPGKPILGTEIEALDDATLAEVVERTTVFAKLTLQKARIVKALQANGHTVGFLGDGINDAPALRDADVGISVDSGADIAKETADIILLEKSLMVLEEGVIKGRETFGNIPKYLNMTASSNFGNVFSVLVASAFLPWEPMLATQLLVLNLIYDTSQMLLPWDKMDPEFLKKRSGKPATSAASCQGRADVVGVRHHDVHPDVDRVRRGCDVSPERRHRRPDRDELGLVHREPGIADARRTCCARRRFRSCRARRAAGAAVDVHRDRDRLLAAVLAVRRIARLHAPAGHLLVRLAATMVGYISARADRQDDLRAATSSGSEHPRLKASCRSAPPARAGRHATHDRSHERQACSQPRAPLAPFDALPPSARQRRYGHAGQRELAVRIQRRGNLETGRKRPPPVRNATLTRGFGEHVDLYVNAPYTHLQTRTDENGAGSAISRSA